MPRRFLAICYVLIFFMATPCMVFAGFDEGQGATPKQDYAAALREWMPLAKQGNAGAQLGVGILYFNGYGVPQSYKEALKWYRLAADQGDVGAQFRLGVMYFDGYGVPQDYKEALKWYRLAADQGDAGAQRHLGVMYLKGHGVTRSRVVAYALFNLSASNDPSATNDAIVNREHIVEIMTSKEIEAAQNLTRELSKPGNLRVALDKYVKKPAVNELVK